MPNTILTYSDPLFGFTRHVAPIKQGPMATAERLGFGDGSVQGCVGHSRVTYGWKNQTGGDRHIDDWENWWRMFLIRFNLSTLEPEFGVVYSNDPSRDPYQDQGAALAPFMDDERVLGFSPGSSMSMSIDNLIHLPTGGSLSQPVGVLGVVLQPAGGQVASSVMDSTTYLFYTPTALVEELYALEAVCHWTPQQWTNYLAWLLNAVLPA